MMEFNEAEEISRPFRDPWDKRFARPLWNADGNLYATDGRVALMLEDVEGADAESCGDPEFGARCAALFRFVLADGARADVPLPGAEAALRCALCAVSERGPVTSEVAFGLSGACVRVADGVVLAAHYVQRVFGLLYWQYGTECLHARVGTPEQSVLFRDDGWAALVMPLRSPGGHPIADARTGRLVEWGEA